MRATIEERIPPQEAVKLVAAYLTFIASKNDKSSKKKKPTRFHAKTIPSIDILGYLSRILKYAPCSTECFLAIMIYMERISLGKNLLFSSSDTNLNTNTGLRTTNNDLLGSSEGMLDHTSKSELNEIESMQRKFSSTHLNGSLGRITSYDQDPIVIDSYNIHRLLVTAALVAIKFLSDVFYTNLHVSRVGGVSVSELNQMELEFLKMIDFSLFVTDEELCRVSDAILMFSTSGQPEQVFSPAT